MFLLDPDVQLPHVFGIRSMHRIYSFIYFFISTLDQNDSNSVHVACDIYFAALIEFLLVGVRVFL